MWFIQKGVIVRSSIPPHTACWVLKKLCFIKDSFSKWVSSNSYSIKEIYMSHFDEFQKISWRSTVWKKLSIPKARFYCWLMTKGKLKAKSKLKLIGVTQGDLCPLCANAEETSDHLFLIILLVNDA